MDSSVPEHLIKEQEAVEAQIRAAFKGVTREGGISWSESRVVDGYGLEEERAAARALDTEQSWEELVDNPKWHEGFGVGGFCFLDAVGFRYYIAPAMIRWTRRGEGEAFTLERPVAGCLDLITPEQGLAIARFVRFMIATYAPDNVDVFGYSWQDVYEKSWREWDSQADSPR